jgi:integrase
MWQAFLHYSADADISSLHPREGFCRGKSRRNFSGQSIMGQLTAKTVSGLLAEGRYLDGDGLSLHVKTPGRRYWTFRYQRDGRERVMTFGNADKVTLAKARMKAAQARDKLDQGIDPLEQKQQAREQARAARAEQESVVTFAQAIDFYIGAHRAGWRGVRSEQSWRASLMRHVVPVFGRKPVGEVTVEDVLKALAPIWTAQAVTAARVRNRIEMVLDYARAHGWRSGENPARWKGGLQPLLPSKAKFHTVKHRVALDWRDAPALMAKLVPDGTSCATRASVTMTERCLAFTLLTATRSAEARGTRWSEIDLQQKVWTIPAPRMKTNEELRVPLSKPAMELLRGVLRTESPFVFFGKSPGRPVHDVTLLSLVKKLAGDKVTVHGFRSCFADWCAEHGKPFELAEAALGHVFGSAVRRAYARSDLLEQRRTLMEAWAAFLTQPATTVVPLRVHG